ncbi:MAG: hypothetical protein MJK12_07405 [Colwellia sp.]|nr:hypothetical protein [Colwellia sp.]
MNLQDNKTLIFCCFLSLLALAGCGLKRDLYQTPESVKGEGFVPEKVEKKTDKTGLAEKTNESEKPDASTSVNKETN